MSCKQIITTFIRRYLVSRYRYPLYRKRSYQIPEAYSYEEDVSSSPFFEEDEYPVRYSLFKNRNTGYSRSPTKKNSGSGYNIALAPYDLQAMGKLYELGKRFSPTDISSSEGHFLDEPAYSNDDLTQLKVLKEMLEALSESSSQSRLKRSATYNADSSHNHENTTSKTKKSQQQNNSNHEKKSSKSNTVSMVDRSKRAFEDYLPWGDGSSDSAPSTPSEEFLTREYFKTIARSVGNKKKRMAYGKFETDKRSSAIDQFLDDPAMLKYMADQLEGILYNYHKASLLQALFKIIIHIRIKYNNHIFCTTVLVKI